MYDKYQWRKILFCLAAWLIGSVLAFLLPINNNVSANEEVLNVELGLAFGLHPILNILMNNYLYLISIYLFGFLSFGVYTIAGFIFNGLLLGLYIKKALALDFGIEKITMLLGVHGPIEIMAFVLAGSLTLVGTKPVVSLLQENFSIKELFIKGERLRKLLFLPFVLIALAAPIEYLTYWFYL